MTFNYAMKKILTIYLLFNCYYLLIRDFQKKNNLEPKKVWEHAHK